MVPEVRSKSIALTILINSADSSAFKSSFGIEMFVVVVVVVAAKAVKACFRCESYATAASGKVEIKAGPKPAYPSSFTGKNPGTVLGRFFLELFFLGMVSFLTFRSLPTTVVVGVGTIFLRFVSLGRERFSNRSMASSLSELSPFAEERRGGFFLINVFLIVVVLVGFPFAREFFFFRFLLLCLFFFLRSLFCCCETRSIITSV